ncbi:MAG: flagellar basal body protein FliL [Rhodocyclales bacterium]|nr:flagellar basal body protein FliL [Rhodocyclales bacterium]
MATKEAPKKEEAEEVAAPPKKSKKLLIIIVSAVVVTLSLGAALGYVLGHKKSGGADAAHEEAIAEDKQEEKKKEEAKKPPVFVALEPFTVNLQPDNTTGEQFLQVVVSLRVADDKKGEELKAFMPQIRHEILSLAGSKKASEITSPDGREILAEDIKDVVNDVLGYEPPKRSKRKKKDAEPDEEAPVMSVFFTQFIVQ